MHPVTSLSFGFFVSKCDFALLSSDTLTTLDGIRESKIIQMNVSVNTREAL